jgi:hypothetical protein
MIYMLEMSNATVNVVRWIRSFRFPIKTGT